MGQPHNKHKRALSAGENVVYSLCYNGLVVAGSHAHFLISVSHAISFWDKDWAMELCLCARGTPHNLLCEPTSSLTPSLLVTPFPSLVALLYLSGISSNGRGDTGCVASQTCSGCQTERLPALRSVSSARQWELFDLTETPLETQANSTAGRLDGFSSQSSSPERKRFAHTVWLQYWCLCCVSKNVSEY